jgi:hypothetical protein
MATDYNDDYTIPEMIVDTSLPVEKDIDTPQMQAEQESPVLMPQ